MDIENRDESDPNVRVFNNLNVNDAIYIAQSDLEPLPAGENSTITNPVLSSYFDILDRNTQKIALLPKYDFLYSETEEPNREIAFLTEKFVFDVFKLLRNEFSVEKLPSLKSNMGLLLQHASSKQDATKCHNFLLLLWSLHKKWFVMKALTEGDCLNKAGFYEDALTCFDWATGQDPDFADATFKAAINRRYLHADHSIENVRHILNLSPHDYRISCFLALSYKEMLAKKTGNSLLVEVEKDTLNKCAELLRQALHYNPWMTGTASELITVLKRLKVLEQPPTEQNVKPSRVSIRGRKSIGKKIRGNKFSPDL